jgi:hypothetical protein
MSSEESISKSLEHKLRHSWKKLTQHQHYLVPETIEDFKTLGPVPYFEIGNRWVFAKDFVKKTVRDVSELLREEMGRDRFAINTIASVVRDELETHFSGKEPHLFEWHVKRILNAVRSHDHRREYVRVVAGLKLKDLDQVACGSWRIWQFSEEHVKEFSGREMGAEDWHQHVEDILKTTYVGKTCISVNCRGDAEQSRLNAGRVANYVTNCLRLFICVHAAEGHFQHEIGIGLEVPNPDKTIAVSFDFDRQVHAIQMGYDSYRQGYNLNARNLQIIRETLHADRLWSLIEKEDLTDLEDSLVTAVTWFGDAQQEPDSHAAYIKYWTALEALVTGHEKERLVSRLKATIPVLISQSSKAAVPSKSRVENAYDLRSKILHRGSRANLRSSDLDQVCNWAWQCILVVLDLTTRGYKTRQQVEEQASKISIKRAAQS